MVRFRIKANLKGVLEKFLNEQCMHEVWMLGLEMLCMQYLWEISC